MGRKGLMLKKWHPDFCLGKDHFNLVPVCIYLPELSTPFYNINVLKALANGIGSLVTINKITKQEGIMNGARFCVYLDITKKIDDKIYTDTSNRDT